ncbi:hypothetical protein vseg_011880 [Gypsophila vaccaria]
MGRNKEESNEFYVENTVFIAVGKQLKESETIISWAVNKFAGRKKICILHVHQPASLVSFFGGKLTVSLFQQKAINALREADIQKLHKLIGQYVVQLSHMGVHADRMWIEKDSVEEGIVQMIVQHGIKWLVMGAAADKYYKKEMAELKSQKAIFVCEQAPVFCHIWFVCRGNLVYTRQGPSVSISVAAKPLNANVTTIGQKVGGPRADALSLESDVSTDESESSPLSDATEEAGYEDAQDVPADVEPLNRNMETEESEYEKLDCVIDEHKSPPSLTFRERSSILRSCSVDFDSKMEHHLVASAHDISTSNNISSTDKGKRRIFRSHSSLSSVSFDGKMEGKSRLQAPREIYNRLEKAISDTANLKQLAFQESVQRWKAEEDAMDATVKANAAESKFVEEMKQRKEEEECLARQRLEQKRFREELDNYENELPIIQAECCDLESQVRESEAAAKELEEKFILAVELLISFRNKRDQLEIEHDDAVCEMESLKKLRDRRVAALSGPQFPTFSLIEISEATCSFDPSKRIGDGTYGGVYHGTFGHMEVAIRMLPNDGIQGQLMFEHQVEILSRVRHPNIVTLLGSCPEARSIVYEYLERGSLEDNLTCRGKTHPLQWQTRVRIAADLCSALIFLHSNNPPIFHGNLKPTKILLDTNFVGKIGDLGIFHLFLQNHTKLSHDATSQNRVSFYTDPEFLRTGAIGPKSDVYSFGVILLQLITGTTGILKDVKQAIYRDKCESILDSSAGDWPIYLVKPLAKIALQCCERMPSKRPDLVTQVWSVLDSLRKSCDTQKSSWQNQETRRPPSHFLCPIYQEVMKDPCTAADGYTYEGDAIREWLDSGHTTSPMTNLELPTLDLIPNHALHYAIQEWIQGSELLPS